MHGYGDPWHLCLCVSVHVHTLTEKRLELSTPNLVDIHGVWAIMLSTCVLAAGWTVGGNGSRCRRTGEKLSRHQQLCSGNTPVNSHRQLDHCGHWHFDITCVITDYYCAFLPVGGSNILMIISVCVCLSVCDHISKTAC